MLKGPVKAVTLSLSLCFHKSVETYNVEIKFLGFFFLIKYTFFFDRNGAAIISLLYVNWLS